MTGFAALGASESSSHPPPETLCEFKYDTCADRVKYKWRVPAIVKARTFSERRAEKVRHPLKFPSRRWKMLVSRGSMGHRAYEIIRQRQTGPGCYSEV
jgi:hypothetical protein